MIVKKPRNINFEATKTGIEKQLKALKSAKNNMLAEKTEIEKIKTPLNREDAETLDWIKHDLIDMDANIKIKEELLQEYIERTAMQMMIDQRNVDDYKQNNFSVVKAAKLFKNDLFLSKELKDHLKEVLSINTSKFDGEQKVQFFLALKKEVEVCRNYKKNSTKHN